MKLSEAMRKGYEENPEVEHLRNRYVKVGQNMNIEGCCALSFAVLGQEGEDVLLKAYLDAQVFSTVQDLFSPDAGFIMSVYEFNDSIEEPSMPEIIAWVEAKEQLRDD